MGDVEGNSLAGYEGTQARLAVLAIAEIDAGQVQSGRFRQHLPEQSPSDDIFPVTRPGPELLRARQFRLRQGHGVGPDLCFPLFR